MPDYNLSRVTPQLTVGRAPISYRETVVARAGSKGDLLERLFLNPLAQKVTQRKEISPG